MMLTNIIIAFSDVVKKLLDSPSPTEPGILSYKFLTYLAVNRCFGNIHFFPVTLTDCLHRKLILMYTL